ncbi:MAG: precorrin-3B C(17)-methyltransferase [Elainella sp.]
MSPPPGFSPAPAILVLGTHSLATARQIQAALPGSQIYGLASRIEASQVEVSFSEFGPTLRQLFASAVPIIGLCATGILIRSLAPLISDKRQEPPVLAVAEDGSAVVPLLGGLQGVNPLARQIGAALQIAPAITTSGDLRFHTALLAPPTGYRLANPDDAKTILADLLAGAAVKLTGTAPWLSQSQLPFSDRAEISLEVTERAVDLSRPPQAKPDRLVYHPHTLAIGLDSANLASANLASTTLASSPPDAVTLVLQQLALAGLAPAAVAGVFGPVEAAGDPVIHAVAEALQVAARFLPVAESPDRAAALALEAVGPAGRLISAAPGWAIAVAPLPLEVQTIGRPQGRLAIVGTGPGWTDWMTPEVKALLQTATDWVGYTTYLNLVEPLRQGQQRHDSDNRVELDRARLALNLAAQGRSVALISSGDPGIYAMATAVFEVMATPEPAWQQVAIQVAPGISALQAAAARIGAPIGHDFCAVSLSDILKPWSIIAERISAAAQADFVIAFYNPVSSQRTWQLDKARDLLLAHRSPETPVVLARNVGRLGESLRLIALADLSADQVDMRTLVLVGSSKTRRIDHAQGTWVYTPRSYGP